MRLLAALAALVFLSTQVCHAQGWPNRPITLIHGFGAGGNADTISRLVAEGLRETLHATIIVEPKSGAGGNTASETVARAVPDGYTLILLTGGHAASAALYKKLRFDPVGSFSFVSLVGKFPFVIATRADGPIKSLDELLAAVRNKKSDTLTFSSVGFGSTQHLAGELFAQAAAGTLTHVPYRGGLQPVTDVLSGRVDLLVDTITVTGGAIKAGTLRGLGITSAQPWPLLPDVPPIASVLTGFEVMSWIGIAGPSGLPDEVVQRLNAALNELTRTPAFQARLEQLGVRAEGSSPEQMKSFISAEIARWNTVIDKAHIERLN